MSKARQQAPKPNQPSLKACLKKQTLTRAKPFVGEPPVDETVHCEDGASPQVEDTVHCEDGASKDDASTVHGDDGCSTVAESENAATLVDWEGALDDFEQTLAHAGEPHEAGQAAGAAGAPGAERVAESAEAVEAAASFPRAGEAEGAEAFEADAPKAKASKVALDGAADLESCLEDVMKESSGGGLQGFLAAGGLEAFMSASTMQGSHAHTPPRANENTRYKTQDRDAGLSKALADSNHESDYLCGFCSGTLDLVRCKVWSKSSGKLMCMKCNNVYQMVTRKLGDFFKSNECSLAREQVQSFFKQCSLDVDEFERNDWNKVKAHLIKAVSASREKVSEAKFGGEYLPLSVYQTRGFNIDDIRRNCTDTRQDSILGTVYKVGILGSSTALIHKEVEKEIANKEHAQRLKQQADGSSSKRRKRAAPAASDAPAEDGGLDAPAEDGGLHEEAKASASSSSSSSSSSSDKKKKKKKASKKEKKKKKEMERAHKHEKKRAAEAAKLKKEEEQQKRKQECEARKAAAQEARKVKAANVSINNLANKTIGACSALVKNLRAQLKHPKARSCFNMLWRYHVFYLVFL